MANFIQIDSLNILNNLRNHEEGEVAYVRDEQKYYLFKDGSWELMQPSDELFKMSLYEMNQMILGEMPELTGDKVAEAQKVISDYVTSKDHADDYYMLLCHELKYFTIFTHDEDNELEVIEDAIFDCLKYVGTVKSVELTADKNAIEIWVTTPENDTFVMYFFDYGRGIVPCRI
jgi:hypothetical protein